MGQAEATFCGQFAGSGKCASSVFHPVFLTRRVPIAIFSGFSMAQGFVLNSATTNVARPFNAKRKACLQVRTISAVLLSSKGISGNVVHVNRREVPICVPLRWDVF